jgi:hypothetical protein
MATTSQRATTSRARYAVAWAVWLLGCAVAIASYGAPGFLLDDTSVVGLVFAPFALLIVTLWATFPFIAVSLAVLDGVVGWVTVATATVTATVALILVPRAVQRSIEGDSSSTAGLAHIYDPLLMVLPVGAVLGIGWYAGRRHAHGEETVQ